MTISPTHSAWQAVAALAALTYEPVGRLSSLVDRLVSILSSEMSYPQGAILLGQTAPLPVVGAWGTPQAELERLRQSQPAPSSNGALLPAGEDGWQGVELQALGEKIGLLLLRGTTDAAVPDEILLTLAGQIALLCATAEATAPPRSDQMQIAAALVGPLYELAGQTDLRRFLTELASQAAQLPHVAAAAVYYADDDRLPLCATAGGTADSPLPAFAQELRREELEAAGTSRLERDPLRTTFPLHEGGHIVGALVLNHTGATLKAARRCLPAYDLFASQSALALRTAVIFDHKRTQGRDLFILYENSRILNSTLDLGTILDRLAENVAFALESDHCIVMTWDQERGEMEYASAFDAVNPLQLGSFSIGERFVPAPDSVPGLVLQSAKPVAIESVADDPNIAADRARLLSFGFKSVLCAPMIQQDQLLGILLVSSGQQRSYNSAEMTLIQTLAGQAAIALGYARVIEEERQRTTQLELLHNLSRELSSGLSVHDAAEAVARVIARIKPEADYEVCIFDTAAQVARVVIRSPGAEEVAAPQRFYTLDQGFTGWLARHRRPLRIDDRTSQHSISPAYETEENESWLRAFLGVPLLLGDEFVGTIELISRTPNLFTPDDELLLTIVAAQAAQAIQNAVSYEMADDVLRKRIRELTALQRISHKLTSTLYLDDILVAVLAEAREATAAPAGMVVLRDEIARFSEDLAGSKFIGHADQRLLHQDERGALRLVAAAGYDDEEQALLMTSLRDLDGPFNLAFTEGEPQIIDDLTLEVATLQLSTLSLLLVPVIYEETIAGLIVLGQASAKSFNRDAVDFVRALADQASLAIGNAQHFAELEKQRELLQRRASLLNEVLEIGNALRADRELPDLLEQVAFSVADAAGFRSVLFILNDHEQPSQMRVVAGAGVPIATLERMRATPLSMEALHPLLDQRFRLRRAFFVPQEESAADSSIDQLFDQQPATGDYAPGAWQPGDRLLVPLYSTDREMIGLMLVDDPFDHQRPNRRIAEILEIFANQAAIAVENASLFRERERQIRGLEAIRRIGQVTNSTLDMENLLQGIHQVMADFLPVDSFVLHVVDIERNLITRSLIVDLGEHTSSEHSRTIPPGSLTEWLLKQRRPLLFGDFAQEIAAYPDIIPNQVGTGKQPASWLGVPLLARDDEPVGVMAIQNYRPHSYNQRDVDFVLSVAHQVSLGLQNARLFSQTESHLHQIAAEAERLATVNRVSNLATSTLDFSALCQIAVDEMARATGADQARLMQVVHAQDVCICRAEHTDTGLVDKFNLPLSSNSVGVWIGREQRPLHIDSVEQDPLVEPLRERLVGLGIRSLLVVPIIVKNEMIAYVGVERTSREQQFTARDAETCQTIANQVATAMENARLFAETERQVTVLQALNEIGRALASTLDVDQLLEELHRELGRVVDTSRSLIALFDADHQLINFPVAYQNGTRTPLQPLPLSDGALSRVIRERRPIMFHTQDEVHNASRIVLEGEGDQPTASWVGVPIMHTDRVLGVINISSVKPYAFNEQVLQFLQSVASQAAIALANARLFRDRERRIRELDAINRINQAVTSTLDLQSVLERMHNGLGEIIDVGTSFIGLYDARTNKLSYPLAFDSGTPVHFSPAPVGENNINRWSIVNRQPLLIGTLEEAIRYRGGFNPVDLRQGRDGEVEQSFLIVPIIANDEVLGVINIQSYERYAYTEQDVNFVLTVAGQAAVAIANARLFSERERRIRELDIVNRVSQAVNSTLDLQSVLERLHNGLGEIIDVRTSFIGLYDARTNIISYPICYDNGRPVHFDPVELRTGTTRWAVTNRQPVLVGTHAESEVYNEGQQVVRFGPENQVEESFLVVPIIANDEVLGVINIQSYQQHAFTEQDLNFVSTVAGQAAAAIANARLFSGLERSIHELGTLNEIGGALGATVRFEDLLQVIYKQTSLLLDTTNFYMALYDERRQQVSYPFFYEHSKPITVPPQRLGSGLTDYVIKTRQRLLIAERFEEFLAEHGIELIDEPAKSWMGVPMIAADKVIGVIGIQDYEREHAYSENEVRLLSTIANQAAQALENARLFTESRESVRELSTLSETSVSLAGTMEMDEILTIGASSTMELARADIGGIFLVEEQAGQLTVGEAIFLDSLRTEIPIADFHKQLLRALDRLPLREGQTVRSGDARASSLLRPLARKLKIHGMAILPIIKEQRLGGAMLIGAVDAREFEERAIASLNILSAQVGQAIENAQLFAQIRRFNVELEEMVTQRTQALAEANEQLTTEKERIEALHTIATELSATLELDEVLIRTLDLAARALNVSHGSIVLRDPESGKLMCRAVLDTGGKVARANYEVQLPRSQGLAHWIIDHPEAEGAVIADVQQDERWLPLAGWSGEARSVIAVPLLSADTAVGVLMFTSPEQAAFTADHLRFLRTIGTEVSAALHNAELYQLVLDSADRLSAALMQQKEEAGKREAILRSVSEGVMVLDQSGTIILYNPAAERVLQVPAETVIGQSLQVFARYEDEQVEAGGEERAVLIYTGLHEGARAVAHDDTIFSSTISLGRQTINANFAPVTSADGSKLGIVVVLRDITREIEADRAKRDFISTVSHELRTPLTPIRGFVDLMLLGATGQLTDTQRDCLTTIKSNTMRMLSLVEDLLEIGRIEAGKIKLNLDMMDIRSSVDEIVRMLQPMIETKQMNLQIEIPDDLPQVEADGKRIGQVLTNLISNAVKYTYAQGNIWVRALTVEGSYVQVEVQDTGVGIKPEDMKKLFTRFFRTDNPLRDEAGGTGLGLSIAKSFVEMHGGEMWVESEINVGSTFKVKLPIQQPRPELDAPHDLS